jgi:hypothetical protein
MRTLPKLTVRVRFPSPAPCSNTVAARGYSRLLVLCRTRLSVFARATLGHTYPHLGTRPSGSEDAQLVPSCDPVLRFFQRRQGESPQIRGRVNGLNYRSHARAGPRDTEVPVRLTIADRTRISRCGSGHARPCLRGARYRLFVVRSDAQPEPSIIDGHR